MHCSSFASVPNRIVFLDTFDQCRPALATSTWPRCRMPRRLTAVGRLPVMFRLDDGFDVFVAARLLHELVALLVHQQLALDALETLSTQAPDTVLAEGTECSLERQTCVLNSQLLFFVQKNHTQSCLIAPTSLIHTICILLSLSFNAKA